jgi:CIC family chloride channel protein
VDEERDYAGIVQVAEAHAHELEEGTAVREILHHADTVLVPTMTVNEAVEAFEKAEAEALAVVQSVEARRVVGLLTEAYALRRYAEGLELRRRELIGE